MYFKAADFLFTKDLVIAYPRLMEFVSPNGCKFGMQITKQNSLVFQVDKSSVLRKLASRAEEAGAELQFACNVTALLKEEGNVKGVIVRGKSVKARTVVSAEGLSRQFSNEAGLYESAKAAVFFVLAQYLKNLRLNESQLGSIGFLGTSRSGLSKASLMFHTMGRHEGMVLLSVLLPEIRWTNKKKANHFLEEAIRKDPILSGMTKGGSLSGRKSCWIVIQKPSRLVADGIIGVGDSVAPLGHSSISIAMFMGREAAFAVGKALQSSDASTEALTNYNKLLKSQLFRGVEFEANLIMSLMSCTDKELDVFCDCFSGVNLEPFLVGTRWQQATASLVLSLKPKVLRNWKLVSRIFS